MSTIYLPDGRTLSIQKHTVGELITLLQSLPNHEAIVEADPGWHPSGPAYVVSVRECAGGIVMLDTCSFGERL